MSGLLADWSLAWPWLLLALPLPWLALRLLPPAHAAQSAALRAPFAGELASLGAAPPSLRRHPRPLPLLAWCLLCLAAARPQQLGELVQPPQQGREMLLAVDLSGSMAIQDMRLGGQIVDRLTAVKAVLGDFLERRQGDRIGLVLFGQRAYAVTPLTSDLASVRQQLYDSSIGLAGQETAIGDAIALAVKRLDDGGEGGSSLGSSAQAERVLILLTDGVNTAGQVDPDRAAEIAATVGVRVHTIGFGGEQVVGLFGMSMSREAEIDEAALKRIATRTGGRYYRARDTAELVGIYAEIDRIEAVEREAEAMRPLLERYHWPLALAGLLGLLLLLPPAPALAARSRGLRGGRAMAGEGRHAA